MSMNTSTHAVAVVDPYSTGGSVAAEFFTRGYTVIALWTDIVGANRTHTDAAVAKLVKEGMYAAEIVQDGMKVEGLAEKVGAITEALGVSLEAVVCGAETGVIITDHLSEHLGLRGNGTAGGTIADRRDKSYQQDAVRAAGLRACREACSTKWDDVKAFCESEPMPVVVKPVESAGSDGVKLCYSVEEAHKHFELLMNSQRKAGVAHGAAVLVQEFLKGSEYVVDQVTRDGVHKTTMVWMYDKRAANGSAFVYYNMVPVESDSDVARSLIKYTRGVLDAIAITNGATHSEIMLTADGPCLVEVNCRCHGGNGAWLPLASRLTGGVTQVGAMADIFTNAAAFDALPDVPPSPFLAGGCNPMFVSHFEGRVLSRPGYERIRALPSFVSLDEAVEVGQHLERTVDLFTSTGQCILVHDDPEVVAADLAAIRAMDVQGTMFEVEPVQVDNPLPSHQSVRKSRTSFSELSERSNDWRAERARAAAAAA